MGDMTQAQTSERHRNTLALYYECFGTVEPDVLREQVEQLRDKSRADAEKIRALEAEVDAAVHALRSYQYGNSDPTLAKEVADEIDAAPPPQPVAPEGIIAHMDSSRSALTEALSKMNAPERGEAKAVAWLKEWPDLTGGMMSCVEFTPYVQWGMSKDIKVTPLYATPQPPPAPRFRDPTIEDAGTMVATYLNEYQHPGHSRADAMLAALKQCSLVVNAIGAKVEEK